MRYHRGRGVPFWHYWIVHPPLTHHFGENYKWIGLFHLAFTFHFFTLFLSFQLLIITSLFGFSKIFNSRGVPVVGYWFIKKPFNWKEKYNYFEPEIICLLCIFRRWPRSLVIPRRSVGQSSTTSLGRRRPFAATSTRKCSRNVQNWSRLWASEILNSTQMWTCAYLYLSKGGVFKP